MKKPKTPTLKNDTLELVMSQTGCSGKNCVIDLVDGKYMYDLAINKQIYRDSHNWNKYEVTGYTVYEKSGSNYKEIATHLMAGSEVVLVELKPGEKKTYVARVYVTNNKGEKIYSDYSNVVTIDHSI